MRLIIYTGKGGVGKTSTSAATAYRLSKLGYRTLLMSTDSAHSLGDSMGINLGSEIKTISENFDALEIDIIHEMKTKWSDIQSYVADFMVSQGMGSITAEEMAIFPGMEMISALFYVNQFYRENSYDVIVMDTAPTGETLRLLSLPEAANWYVMRFYGTFKKLMALARMTVGKVSNVPLPSAEVMDTVDILKETFQSVSEILDDPKCTTVRLVLNPEQMVIKETMRAYTYLSLYNRNVEMLVVNKLYPDEVLNTDLFKLKKEEQTERLEEIHRAFDPMEIKYCHMRNVELRGLEMLDAMAQEIYGDEDPTKVYSSQSPMTFRNENGEDHLVMKMPFVEAADVELFRVDSTSLMVHVGSQKRNIHLPDSLISAEIL
ncbi:MAG: TRC40/GET3/ArsA family transport-energizing ATPase, partial [Candidatus Methanomethylophilaceae archaeon]|nr:TRC40/GET3/ArsA family transport-energizing ATPase [Candidatus Methanomethylophilaceae archaeon]